MLPLLWLPYATALYAALIALAVAGATAAAAGGADSPWGVHIAASLTTLLCSASASAVA